jgi:plasmid stabilization system protein ParE
MTLSLEFLDEALEEAEEAVRGYAKRSPGAAAAFVEELDRAVAEIQRAPGTWPPYDHDTRRFLLGRFPYSVVYRSEAHRLVVIAVAHAHRRPGYWRERLRSTS